MEETILAGTSYFHIASHIPTGPLPPCLFLAGFDQLTLGYEKTESLFLPPEYIRDIFTRSGIVRPALLVDGRVAGWWRLKNARLTVRCFSPVDHARVADTAAGLWPQIRKIEFE